MFTFGNRKSLVIRCRRYEASDWLAWLSPSSYTATHRLGVVMTALDGVFMRVDVNGNFFENDAVCTMLFWKTEGGKYSFLKIPDYV